ncbi:hypothetical protein EPI10_019422 [Gossypium australe]|uniref:Uncharacterized protein n=1 Tax=Gossypium australe TaxID=47621 RepID=A0A5B6WBZ5_9ROSI|nr:hypothetical protein EPI10_019422 [Gossypium australe]
MCYPFPFFFHKAILNLGAFSIFPTDSNEGSVVPLLPGTSHRKLTIKLSLPHLKINARGFR